MGIIAANTKQTVSLVAGHKLTVIGQANIDIWATGHGVVSQNVSSREVIGPFGYDANLDILAGNQSVVFGFGDDIYSQPGFVLIGDSTSSLGNDSGVVTLTASGTEVTAQRTGHGCLPGSIVFITNANEPEYNGIWTVKTVVDANNFKFDVNVAPSVSPATGSVVMVNQQRVKDHQWANLSNYMSHLKGLYLGNFACGGTRTAQLDGQLDFALNPANNLWNKAPRYVFVSTGINDAINDVSYDSMVSNLNSALARIIAYGAIPIVLTTWPYNQNAANWSVSRIGVARRYNQWIRDNVPGMGCIVIDAFDACVDKTNQYGNWKTNYSTDGVHPAKKAAFQVAKLIKSALWDNVVSADDRVLTAINTNTTLTGTSGTASGTGASGSVANSMTMSALGGGSQTVVGAKGVAFSGGGESQRLTITGAAALDRGQFEQSAQMSSVAVAGKNHIFRCRIRCTDLPEAFRYIQASLNLTISGTSSSQVAAACLASDTNSWGEPFDMTFESPPFITPASGLTSFNNSLVMAFQSAGSATFDVSDFGVFVVE